MKTALLAVCIALVASCIGAEAKAPNGQPLQQAKSIFNDDGVTVTGPSDLEYVAAYSNGVDMISKGKLVLVISTDRIASLLDAVSFKVNWTTGQASIVFNMAAITMYEKYRTLIYGMITHALWFAYQ